MNNKERKAALVKEAEEVRATIQREKLKIKDAQRNINSLNDYLKEIDVKFKELGGWDDSDG